MRYAFVFPGQGAQEVGMGRELAGSFTVARETFRAADDALGFALSTLAFEGPEEELQKTEFTQPAILTHGVALYRVLTEEFGLQPSPACLAGHSLGEYTAHVAAGALSLEDAVRLVNRRGRLMQETVPLGQGAMAAVIGLDAAAVRKLCEAEQAGGAVCEAVNYNAPTQTVVSGEAEAVGRLATAAKEKGAKRAVMLKVSAPFHSSMMRPMREHFRPYLEEVPFHTPRWPIVANVSARPVCEPGEIRKALLEQNDNPVLWTDSVATMREMGVDTIVEFGPGRILSGLAKKISRELTTKSLRSEKECAQLLDFLGRGQ
ncbi:MAG: ACP S-malonyltransferase [Synergistales bacterium]|nr:ACP S-malonyltransferase [Synergistales bacterium]